jgi:hypothetical protein
VALYSCPKLIALNTAPIIVNGLWIKEKHQRKQENIEKHTIHVLFATNLLSRTVGVKLKDIAAMHVNRKVTGKENPMQIICNLL